MEDLKLPPFLDKQLQELANKIWKLPKDYKKCNTNIIVKSIILNSHNIEPKKMEDARNKILHENNTFDYVLYNYETIKHNTKLVQAFNPHDKNGKKMELAAHVDMLPRNDEAKKILETQTDDDFFLMAKIHTIDSLFQFENYYMNTSHLNFVDETNQPLSMSSKLNAKFPKKLLEHCQKALAYFCDPPIYTDIQKQKIKILCLNANETQEKLEQESVLPFVFYFDFGEPTSSFILQNSDIGDLLSKDINFYVLTLDNVRQNKFSRFYNIRTVQTYKLLVNMGHFCYLNDRQKMNEFPLRQIGPKFTRIKLRPRKGTKN